MSEALFNEWRFSNDTIVNAMVQFKYSTLATSSTATTATPMDNSIPQVGEGTQIFSLAFTPKKVGNLLKFRVNIFLGHSAGTGITLALFKDGAADAIAATGRWNVSGTGGAVVLEFITPVTSTSEATYTVRAGGSTGSTLTVNGIAGTRVYGGVGTGIFSIEEYQYE